MSGPDELVRLEAISRQLDTSPEELTSWLETMGQHALRFVASIPEARAFLPLEGELPLDRSLPSLPSPVESVLAEYEASALESGVHPVSGRFFGYVPGGGLPSAALGDFVAALTNRYSGVFLASPGAAEIENLTVAWLREIVGYPTGSWGTLTSGGTLAALAAVAALRDARPQPRWSSGVFYMTAEIHHATEKALRTAGLAHVPVRQVRVDADFRMDPSHLAALVAADRAAGRDPWAVFASAGTVNTGAVDPLPALATFCHQEGLWLHVDAAYGGFFALTHGGRKVLEGIADADSLVLDPHKGLFLPYGCGAVLVRDRGALKTAFSFGGDYLEDVSDPTRSSPADYSPELTRHFRGLRLWVSLKIHGVERFAAALEEKLLLARHAFERLSEVEAVEMGPRPQLSIVTFRHRDGDEATGALLRSILSRGRVHLSSTRLGRNTFLRMCVLCFRSHLSDVDAAIAEVRGVAHRRG